MRRSTLLAALLALPLLLAPARAEETLRLSTGIDLWTIRFSAVQRFVDTGTFSDQRLMKLVENSGWPEAELREALSKPYAVDLVPLARFLYAPAGVAFLQQQTRSYVPLRGKKDLRVEGLRAAILRDAQDGTISALGIMRALPTAFVLMDDSRFDGRQQRCSNLPCDNPQQCSSLLSWYVFLPACLQAAASG